MFVHAEEWPLVLGAETSRKRNVVEIVLSPRQARRVVAKLSRAIRNLDRAIAGTPCPF